MRVRSALLVLAVVLLLSLSVVASAWGASTEDDDEASTASPPLRVGISLWSRFELSKEAEKGIKDAAERLVRERINIKGLGGVAADCFILKSEGEQYIVYMRVFGKLPSGTPEASEGKAKTWEATFKYDPELSLIHI